jgi:hypothetical protein
MDEDLTRAEPDTVSETDRPRLEDLDAVLAGLAQAKCGDARPADEFFAELFARHSPDRACPSAGANE